MIAFFSFQTNLFFGLEEWMTNQWLRQIERKRDTTFSFFMQNLCIFSNKNCQRPFVFIQKKPTACCCINSLCVLDTVQDFFIMLGIKPCLHILKISIFSLNHIIVRPTKIMNNLLKVCKICTFKIIFRHQKSTGSFWFSFLWRMFD